VTERPLEVRRDEHVASPPAGCETHAEGELAASRESRPTGGTSRVRGV
jgi:hypothetical protein